MNPDKYQQAWQAESSQTRVTVDADLLLEEVQRHDRNFRATIFWRDFREIGIALVMIPVWFYLGIKNASPWTWYLTVPALIWLIGFLLVDRKRHPQAPNEPSAPLLECVRNSLRQVEHQIWLLRNVFWWYLLPFTISLMVFFTHVAWRTSDNWLDALGMTALLSVFLLIVYGAIYYVNQFAVRKALEPRRRELLRLLTSLQDETGSEASGDYPLLMNARNEECSPRRRFVASVSAMVLLLIGVLAIVYLAYRIDQAYSSRADEDPLKRSPFAAVRWQQFQPEVKVGDEWYKLVSLNDLPAEEIVAFSRRTYGNKWQKRFEEDLVELLSRMGHPPQDTVKLVVQSLTSSETQVLEDVPMTYANRRKIREAAQARENSKP